MGVCIVSYFPYYIEEKVLVPKIIDSVFYAKLMDSI